MGSIGKSTYKNAYDIHGLSLSVMADSKSVVKVIDSVLLPFSVTPGQSAESCKVVIDTGDVPREIACPAGMRQFWVGTLNNGTTMAYWMGDNIYRLDVLGLVSSVIDIRTRRAQVTVCEGEEWSIMAGGGMLSVLVEFLRASGHHVVHAATLACEKNGENKGILIVGESGKGKTTTALALRGFGTKLLADDVSFVTNDPELGTCVWGLPRACKVHYKTLEMLTWLQDLPQSPTIIPEEFFIDVSEDIASCPTKVKPQIIIFLDDRNTEEHCIKPINKIEAVKTLTRENVRASDPNLRGVVRETFRSLGALVGCCDCYLLSAGPDIAGLHDVVTSLLR